MNTDTDTARRDCIEQEREELYQQCRDLVAWGIKTGLIHRPPDAGEQDDEPAIDGAVRRAAFLGQGHGAKRNTVTLFAEEEVEEVAEESPDPDPVEDAPEELQEAGEGVGDAGEGQDTDGEQDEA